MHQQPRRLTSPATSPQTNPARTNNPREAGPLTGPSRSRAGSEMSARDAVPSPTVPDAPGFGPSSDAVKKLDQIVQNLYAKAAALVLQSRKKLKPVINIRGSGNRKLNKWFNIETEEFDDFREDLRIWRSCGTFDNRPPPMIIETYLDTSRLTSSQSLVLIDENGKRWDVMEALNSSDSSSDGSGGDPGLGRRNTEVILERWRVELKALPMQDKENFGPILPTIYKKAIVFFRSLFALTRVLPAWKFYNQSAKGSHPALELRCRIRTGEPEIKGLDRLRHPLYDSRGDPVTDYVIGDLDVPGGRFYASVTYRNECSFKVDDAESLLSSRFMGVDETFFKPSLPQKTEARRDSLGDVGSLVSRRHAPNVIDIQAYGSLSTFHGEGQLGTSPISALKAVRPSGSEASSPREPGPSSALDIDPPHSLPIHGHGAPGRPPIRPFDGAGRRPSVSFQPFKAGSLSGSPIPRMNEEVPASPHSISRTSGLAALTQARNRNSLTAGMPASLRGIPTPIPADTGTAGGAASPRPSAGTSRYSSSFTHRRGRLSFGGASKAGDDEQGSSGRQSLASSVAQPGSGLLAEQAIAGSSSGSLQADNDKISDFLKLLDSKKTLKSFEPTGKKGVGEGAAANRAMLQLSRLQQMRTSNDQLTESMTSSLQMHRSSSSSSRQLTSVPGMVPPATSMSTSSSPGGKPLSPHTPHTPAIPSRLSENSIIEYQPGHHQAGVGRVAGATPAIMAPPSLSRENTITQDGTTPMDIPVSPRLPTHGRRVGPGGDEDADLAFATENLSLDDNVPPTMSMLLGRQIGESRDEEEEEDDARPEERVGLEVAADLREKTSRGTAVEVGTSGSSGSRPSAGFLSPGPSTSPYGRRRYGGMMGGTGAGASTSVSGSGSGTGRGMQSPQMQQRRPTPSSGSSSRGSSFVTAGGTRYQSATSRAGGDTVDDEPLLFDMSEVDAARRSLEEGRGGHQGHHASHSPHHGHGSGGSGERGGLEPRGTANRGWRM